MGTQPSVVSMIRAVLSIASSALFRMRTEATVLQNLVKPVQEVEGCLSLSERIVSPP
jgi:hypothetical protein